VFFFFIPVGIGFKLNMAKGINIDLGYQVNFMRSDNVDGYAYGLNKDKFAMTHLGLEFALGDSEEAQLAAQKRRRVPIVLSLDTTALVPTTPQQLQTTTPDLTKVAYERQKRGLDSTNAKLAALTRDSDSDGVVDAKDKCPNTPPHTKVDSTGCPLPPPVVKPEVKPEVKLTVSDEDRAAVKAGIQRLEFFPGTSIIHGYSFTGLDVVAALLIKKNMSVRLEGHTDNTGKPDDNLRLSKERAEAVRNYLVGRGVKAERVETVGFGATHPMASNKTEEGRRLNRRVEFFLHY